MSWTKFLPSSQSIQILREVSGLCSELGGPLSKHLHQMLVEDRFLDLCNYSFNYSDSEISHDDFLYARQIQALVSKQDFLDLKVNTENVAFNKFLTCEEKCRKTNDRFLDKASLSRDTTIVLHYASRKIASILGDCPSTASLDFSFGPGATTGVKKAFAHPLVKLNASLECSSSFVHYAMDFLDEFPGWRDSKITDNKVKFKVTPSKLTFVPKTCLTDRPICIEPLLNGLYQKGIGSFIKDRLYKAGVNLRDQSINQRAAKEASISGSFATLDLASASDTISYMVVLDLLPPAWFELLERGRSSQASYKGKVIELERFSSMGNAYTFELESLIFYAICYGVCRYMNGDPSEICVFGDDLIVRTEQYDLLVQVLEDCGFEVNSSKSFRSGPFRESCGADYLRGCDIRPFYQRTLVSDRTLFIMHNWFIRACEHKLACLVKSFIKPHNLIYGPDGYGDGHLIGSYRLRKNRKIKRMGYEGGFFDTFSLTPRRFRHKPSVPYVYPLYCTYVSDPEMAHDHSILPGTNGYHRLSLYILDNSVFRRYL